MAVFNGGATVVIERQDGPQLTGRWAGVEEGMAQLTAAFMRGPSRRGRSSSCTARALCRCRMSPSFALHTL